MTDAPTIGDNNPPDPIDEALAPYGDAISEAENWLDGDPVQNEDQMKAVDSLTKQVKAALSAINKAEKSAAAPLYDAWKEEKAKWKPTIDDLGRIRDGLVACVADFKRKLAEQKKAEERAKWEAAEKARRKAEEAEAKADASDIEAQRAAETAKQEALEKTKAAQAAKKDAPKGLRKVTKYEIQDHKAALHWIARNDRDAVTDFIDEYVRRNHKTAAIEGVKVWEDKEAF